MSSTVNTQHKHSADARWLRQQYRTDDRAILRRDRLDRNRLRDEAMRDDLFAALDASEPAKIIGVHERVCPLAEWECLLLRPYEDGVCNLEHYDTYASLEAAADEAWEAHETWADQAAREREHERCLAELDAEEEREAASVGRSSRWLPLVSAVGGLEALDFGFHADDTSRVSQRFSDAAGYIRVSKLAERLDVPNTALVQYLQGSGEFVKSPSSRVALAVAERIEAHPYLADGLRQVHGNRTTPGAESDRALEALRHTLLGS